MKYLLLKSCLFLMVLIWSLSSLYSQNKDYHIFNDSLTQLSEISANSARSDFGPAIIEDTLYFTTFNDRHLVGNDKRYKFKGLYGLYEAAADSQGNVTGNPLPLDLFNTDYNVGPVAFCSKTGELFITLNYNDQLLSRKSVSKKLNRLRIIVAKRLNGKWTQVSDFPYNNPQYSVGHPAVTQSGDTLVFSSDKPGGFGETDLYYSVRKKGNWYPPVNLGPKINTAGKEEFGYIMKRSQEGQYLIFSSKGRFGFGGFDLYYTRFPSDYTEIFHFTNPVNTKYDDFAMTIPSGARYGYLTSNRPGTGDDDIYKFTFRKIERPQQAQKPKEKCRTIYVFDQTSRRPIPGVRIISCWNKYFITDSDGKLDCLPVDGNNCEVRVSTFGYPELVKVFSDYLPDNKGIAVDTIWMDIIVDKKITLKNIYYDFDKWDILPESAAELDRLVALMKENPGMTVELGSHTDERGTDAYNIKLSELRARAAVDYLVSKEIGRSRLKGTGYGKTQLIHKVTGKQKCTPEQNRENRRTEIFIPGFLRGEPVHQKSGDFSDGPSGSPVKVSNPVKGNSLINKSSGKEGQPKSSEKYFVILGSFKEKKVATELVKKLKGEAKKAAILFNSGQYRVGLPYPDYIQASKAKDLLRRKYKSAWVLTQ